MAIDSPRIKKISVESEEIHTALSAGTYGDGRVWNLGEMIRYLSVFCGFDVAPNGIPRVSEIGFNSAPDPLSWNDAVVLDPGYQEKGSGIVTDDGVPEGKPGIAYRSKTNRFTFDGTQIQPGSVYLCSNVIQLLHLIMADLDKAIGIRDSGAMIVPNASRSANIRYEGLSSLLTELGHVLSFLSMQSINTRNSAAATEIKLNRLAKGLGLPEKLEIIENLLGKSADGTDYVGSYPTTAVDHESAESITDQLTSLRIMVGTLYGDFLQRRTTFTQKEVDEELDSLGI